MVRGEKNRQMHQVLIDILITPGLNHEDRVCLRQLKCQVRLVKLDSELENREERPMI